jgi:hypothetical protein
MLALRNYWGHSFDATVFPLTAVCSFFADVLVACWPGMPPSVCLPTSAFHLFISVAFVCFSGMPQATDTTNTAVARPCATGYTPHVSVAPSPTCHSGSPTSVPQWFQQIVEEFYWNTLQDVNHIIYNLPVYERHRLHSVGSSYGCWNCDLGCGWF